MLIKSKTNPEQAFSTVMNELKKGSSDSRHPFRYLSLATFDPQNKEPNIRMLILREVQKDKSLVLYTDNRTDKVKELEHLNNAALLFWHDHHKVQVTVKASIELHRNDEVSQQYWKQDVHGPAQKAYTPLIEPGAVIEQPSEAHSWPEEYTDEHFCVINCIPYEIQILQLGGKKHSRLQFQRAEDTEEWSGGWIAP